MSGKKCPDLKLITLDEYKRLVRNVEPLIIKRLSPALNGAYNLNPGKDTTPKNQKEKDWEKCVDQAYDEIFNKKS